MHFAAGVSCPGGSGRVGLGAAAGARRAAGRLQRRDRSLTTTRTASNDRVMDNTVADNGAWGILFVPYAQEGKPSLNQTCGGSGGHKVPGFGCVLDPEGDALVDNTFSHNGFFGNPTNSDYGQITLFGGEPQNCFSGNNAPDGSAPRNLEKKQSTCGPISTAGNTGGPLFGQVLCDAGPEHYTFGRYGRLARTGRNDPSSEARFPSAPPERDCRVKGPCP
jgi:hypothetical protein